VKQRLKDVYEFFPLLREMKWQNATYLSGGGLQMLCIGKEIMTKPELLLIDEPSSGLAPIIVKEIYQFLRRLTDQGTTIFIVDQNIVKALEISDYMYLLEMGSIKKRGNKEDFEASIRDIIRDSLWTS
jgi:branched-chain amino acid transport system ATP-binding protein